MTDIRKIYIDFFEKNKVFLDEAQSKILDILIEKHEKLVKYKNQRRSLVRFIKKFKVPPGIYLHGGVGRGKTMLLEAFYELCPLVKKRKVHYHSFILEVHHMLHQIRSSQKRTSNELALIARNLASKYRLLYIDEMEIKDITDATIIGGILKELFKNNVMIIISSNRKPDDLYLDGLKREYFLETIELIKQKMLVIEIKSETDYRLEKIKAGEAQTYFYPINEENQLQVNKIIGDKKIQEKILEVNGRNLTVKSVENMAIFDFKELCRAALGSADYLEIAKSFKIVALLNIPRLQKEDRNEARRFIKLIDVLYEQKIILIALAEVRPEEIYREEFDGGFEFQRTISRIYEMQSSSYLN